VHFKDIFNFKRCHIIVISEKDIFSLNNFGNANTNLEHCSYLSVVDIYCNKCKINGSL
jgi:hypothetical protein